MVFPGRKFFDEFPHSLSLSGSWFAWEKLCVRKSAKRPSSINLKPKIDFAPTDCELREKFFSGEQSFSTVFVFFFFFPFQCHPRSPTWRPVVTCRCGRVRRCGSSVRPPEIRCPTSRGPGRTTCCPTVRGFEMGFFLGWICKWTFFFCGCLTLTGEEQFTSSVYVIENMDRHKGGTYICTANNGVGQVATSQIILHVLCEYFGSLFNLHYLCFIFLNIESCSL